MTEETQKASSESSGANAPKLHPIQLVAVQPLVLSISAHADPDDMKDFEGVVKLESTHTEYDELNKIIQVKVRALIPRELDLPLSLHVEIAGVFQVDEDRFSKDNVDAWATRNAPYLLYPFLREQIFSLSVRIGATGIIVPLFEIPTFRHSPK